MTAKVVYQMSVSLDGFVAGPDGDLSWHRITPELHGWMNGELATCSWFLDGRRTWELMADFWPSADEDPDAPAEIKQFAAIWRDTPKLVWSRTLETTAWGTQVRREVDPDEVRALRDAATGDLALGGADLAATFLREDLVDEVRLLLMPVVLGAGTRLFPADLEQAWSLAETRRFPDDVLFLRYTR